MTLRPALRVLNLPGGMNRVSLGKIDNICLTDHELVLLLTNLPQLTHLQASTVPWLFRSKSQTLCQRIQDRSPAAPLAQNTDHR